MLNIVRDSEPIRLLKSPRSLSVCILMMIIIAFVQVTSNLLITGCVLSSHGSRLIKLGSGF